MKNEKKLRNICATCGKKRFQDQMQKADGYRNYWRTDRFIWVCKECPLKRSAIEDN